ncbi:hypothetical protein BJ742DRAFT_74491 [Cladochytrium replicatum]|nr:hypothetical protein BJ742DRAFT_74491 [Cladochytrium replicatum]
MLRRLFCQYCRSRQFVKVLDLYHHSQRPCDYTTNEAMDLASNGGHIKVLEWWKASGRLKWTSNAMDWASRNGHVDGLEWWKSSGLEFKWSGPREEMINDAHRYRKTAVALWTLESLPTEVKPAIKQSFQSKVFRWIGK